MHNIGAGKPVKGVRRVTCPISKVTKLLFSIQWKDASWTGTVLLTS